MMLLNKAINKLESLKAEPWQYVLAMLFFVFLRHFLDRLFEGISGNITVHSIIMEYGLWYFNFFLTIVLLLYLFTKQPISKVFKVSLIFWPLIIFVPLVDFFFSSGKGYVLMYVPKRHFWGEFLSFFGFLGTEYITYGQAFVALTGMILIMLYVFEKTKNSALKFIFPILSGAIFYSLFYFYVGMPDLIFGFDLYTFLIILFLIQLSVIAFLFDKETFLALLKASKPFRAMHYLLLCLFGMLVASISSEAIPLTTVFASLISIFFAWEFAVVVNNFYDKEIPRKIDKNLYMNCGAISLIISIVLASLTNLSTFFILLCFVLAYAVYSMPPARLKRLGFANNLVIGLCSVFAFLLGFTSITPDIKSVEFRYIFAVFVIFSIAANIKDFKDYESDKRAKIKTLPVLLGKKRALYALAFLTSICFPLSVVILSIPKLFLISLLFATANFLLFMKFCDEKVVFATYFIFFIFIFLETAGITFPLLTILE